MGNCLGLEEENLRSPSTSSSCSSAASLSSTSSFCDDGAAAAAGRWRGAEDGGEGAVALETQSDLESVYRIGRELGRGQFGVIRACTHIGTGRSFACKSIPVDEERLQGVLAEAEIMRKLGPHPHIVQLFDVFRDASHVHLVMERCRDGDLFDRLASKGRFSEPHAASLLSSLLLALLHCHRHGIIHRDVKPENLLLVRHKPNPPSIKLADFGLALDLDRGDVKNGMVGSTFYMAPEVLEGREYNEHVDVWSAGVILYLLLSGAPPFGGETEEEIYDAIKEGNLDFTIDPTWRKISSSAKDLITKMLCSNASNRIDVAQVLEHPWILKHTSNLSSKIMELSAQVKDGSLCPERSASRDVAAEVVTPPFTSKLLDVPSHVKGGLSKSGSPTRNGTKCNPTSEGLFSKWARMLEKKVLTFSPHFSISIQVDNELCTRILLWDALNNKTLLCQHSSLASYLLSHGSLKDSKGWKVLEHMPILEKISWPPSHIPLFQLHLSYSLC